MVVNGATKHGDMVHFDAQLAAFRASGGDASYEYLHSQNLVALQVRPGAVAVGIGLTFDAHVIDVSHALCPRLQGPAAPEVLAKVRHAQYRGSR